MPDYSQFVPLPDYSTINHGLSPAHQSTMLQLFGAPGKLSKNCTEPTNKQLLKLLSQEDVGPFKVRGLKLLLADLREIFAQVKQQPAFQPENSLTLQSEIRVHRAMRNSVPGGRHG